MKSVVTFRLMGIFLLLTVHCGLGQPDLAAKEIKTVTKEKLKYYLYHPKDYKVNKDEKFPLLLFLHGGGASGDSLAMIRNSGPIKLLIQGKEFPFLILAPQNPHKKKWWNTGAVMTLLDKIVATNRVDENKIYLTGESRGGGAAWEIAVEYPEKFAALSVVCGMAPIPYASWIDKSMPIWVFHGEEDDAIPFSESVNMVNKLRALGYNVKFTKYKGMGHNIWDLTYANADLYNWFVKQRKQVD